MTNTTQLFDKVTIIGFGLIGSSIAQALKKTKTAGWIVCADQSSDVCDIVLEQSLADEVTTDLIASVALSDLVIICVPVGAIDVVTKMISKHVKDGAIVTDVGSVKGVVATSFKKHLPKHVHAIPGHPLAGTEHSGPEAGFAELFIGRWCVLTPPKNADDAMVQKLSELWQVFGSNVQVMDVDDHDRILAITSHLPHLIAYSIVDTAVKLEDDIKSEVIKFSATGFRDFTRIAASDPVMWRDVFLNNRDAVLEILDRYNDDIDILKKAIKSGDGQILEEVFTRTRSVRRAILDAKQARSQDHSKPGCDKKA